jgi:transcriptional regulator with XRE-family HTH domain
MPEQPTTLRDMINKVLASGVTYRQLAERAIDPDSGATVSRGQLNKIARGDAPRMPEDGKLRAIAAALRAPYESVRQAAVAQWFPDAATPLPPDGIDPKQWASWDDTGRQMVLDALKIAERRRAQIHSNGVEPADY